MKWRWEDKQIGDLFGQLRLAEAREIPSFQEVLYRDEPAGRLDGRLVLRYGLVAGCLLLLSATLLLNLGGEAVPEQRSAPGVLQPAPPLSLAEWSSPTGFLLPDSGGVLVATLPVVETEPWWGLPGISEQ